MAPVASILQRSLSIASFFASSCFSLFFSNESMIVFYLLICSNIFCSLFSYALHSHFWIWSLIFADMNIFAYCCRPILKHGCWNDVSFWAWGGFCSWWRRRGSPFILHFWSNLVSIIFWALICLVASLNIHICYIYSYFVPTL